MAFKLNGLEEFSLSLKELAELPEETREDMLQAGADILVPAFKQRITSLGLVDTGQMVNSIRVFKKHRKRNNGELSYSIYPAGTRKSQGKKKVPNAVVAFIHEYGAPNRGIPGKQWMKTVLEENADAVAEAQARVYDEYLKSKNL